MIATRKSGLVRPTRLFAFGGGFLAALLIDALFAVRDGREAAHEKERFAEAQRMWQEATDVANRSRSEVLSRMSHELRAPLNAVLGFAQLLEIDDLTESQTVAVGHIIQGGHDLLSLINAVGDLAHAPIEESHPLIQPVSAPGP
jgi:signal transduction histidine kinase